MKCGSDRGENEQPIFQEETPLKTAGPDPIHLPTTTGLAVMIEKNIFSINRLWRLHLEKDCVQHGRKYR